jgi:aspartyl-tRNA synthetase
MHAVFVQIFAGLEREYSKELAIIREQYPSEPAVITEKPVILHWHDAISLLTQAGHEVCDRKSSFLSVVLQMLEFEDLSSRQEVLLGELVKEKYHTDFFILDKYPLKIRCKRLFSCC